jgi:hypothetical protein
MPRSSAPWIVWFALMTSSFGAGANDTIVLSDAVYHQLDFWLGEWEVVDARTQEIVGHARLEKLLKGAVVTMIWSEVDGSEIREWFYYEPSAGRWEQLFISDSGTVKRREMITQSEKEVCFVGKVTEGNEATFVSSDKETHFIWRRLGPDKAHWEQQVLLKDGRWETNWAMEFSRVNTP